MVLDLSDTRYNGGKYKKVICGSGGSAEGPPWLGYVLRRTIKPLASQILSAISESLAASFERLNLPTRRG